MTTFHRYNVSEPQSATFIMPPWRSILIPFDDAFKIRLRLVQLALDIHHPPPSPPPLTIPYHTIQPSTPLTD